MSVGSIVHLHLYDITVGLAARFSPGVLGKRVDAIWHSGIVAYGKEYFFEGGITCVPAATTRFGRPVAVIPLGRTEVPQGVFEAWTMEIEAERYGAMAYHIIRNNCNHFTTEASVFLTGNPIPAYVLSLPEEIMDTPLGGLLAPVVDRLMESVQQQLAAQERMMYARAGVPMGKTLPECVMAFTTPDTRPIAERLAATYVREPVLARLQAFLADPLSEVEAAGATSLVSSFAALRESTVPMHWVVLDILRLLVLREAFAAAACDGPDGEVGHWLHSALTGYRSAVVPAQAMTLRLVCNLFSTNAGATLILSPFFLSPVVDIIGFTLANPIPTLRVVAAAAAHNIAIRCPDLEGDAVTQLFTALCQVVESEDHPEASATVLAALTHLLRRSPAFRALFQSLSPRLHTPGRSLNAAVRHNAGVLVRTLIS